MKTEIVNSKTFFSTRSLKKSPTFSKTKLENLLEVGHTEKKVASKGNAYKNTKTGFRTDIQLNVRSNWEANFVRILNGYSIKFEFEPTVFSFPIKAPEGAIVRNDLTAIEHLNIWLVYQRAWCEHKPSITVSVKEDEWMEVGAWVYKHFDEVSGISFLPHSDHSYKQAPYQEVDKAEYDALVSKMPKEIRWEDLSFYETEDGTSTNATLACSSDGNCELVDISA